MERIPWTENIFQELPEGNSFGQKLYRFLDDRFCAPPDESIFALELVQSRLSEIRQELRSIPEGPEISELD